MKKNKEILKQAGTVGFLYLMLCVGGAYESYFRGADLNFTARIAGCVLLCVCLWTFICIIKKKYDPRMYLGFLYLFISSGLMLQIVVQGNIVFEKRIKVCAIGYVFSVILGIILGLYESRKIIVKNKVIKQMLHIICAILGFFIIFLCSVGRRFMGRRGAILIEMTGGQKNSAIGFWYCILGLTLVFTLISSMLITCVIAVPDQFKKGKKA